MTEKKSNLLSDEEAKALWSLYRDFYEADRLTREEYLVRLKKLEYFWHGYHFLVRSHGSGSFYSNPVLNPEAFTGEEETTHYTKVINLFRAHGESIIAALSVEMPRVIFNPDDAEESDDIETAQAFTNASKLIQKHNKDTMSLTKVLFLLFIEPFVACYSCIKSDDSYGVNTTRQFIQEDGAVCPVCDSNLSDYNEQKCYNCENIIIPEKGIYAKEVESKEEAKSRVHLDFFGASHVFIPHYCRKYEEIPILRLAQDFDYSELRYRYEHAAEEIRAAEDPDTYERTAREAVEYKGFRNTRLATEQIIWFEPCSLMSIEDKSIRDSLRKKAGKKGLKAIFVNDIFVKAEVGSLKDEWTLSVNPVSKTIFSDPVGKPLVQPNEIKNELTNLTLQTIEHGIPQTFANEELFDFQAYRENKTKVGAIYPVRPQMGRSLEQEFVTVKTASLSSDIKEFDNNLDQVAQFVVGSFPSIYGGQMSGSRTAAEYQMSRNQALQRLSITWKIVTNFWCELIHRSTLLFMKALTHDEKYSDKKENGFLNVWIRKPKGKLGSVEPETSDIFPVSWAQKRDILMDLLQMNSEMVNQTVFTPQNASFIKKVIGIQELEIPEEEQRRKQRSELDLLLNMAPQSMLTQDPMNPMQEGPSIQPEPGIDKHEIHIEECIMFLVSERGQLLKIDKPEGYANIVAHKAQHEQMMQQEMMQDLIQQMQQQGQLGNQVSNMEFKVSDDKSPDLSLDNLPEFSDIEGIEIPPEEETETSEIGEVEPPPEKEEEEVEPEIEGDLETSFVKRPTFAQIKEKFPDFFKKFPELKHAFYRESEMTKMFPTVDEARNAYQKSEIFDQLEGQLMQGNIDTLFDHLGKDPEIGSELAVTVLPALERIHPSLLTTAVAPYFESAVRNMFIKAHQSQDENMKNAALYVMQFLGLNEKILETNYDPHRPRSKRVNVDPKLEQDRNAFYKDQFNTALKRAGAVSSKTITGYIEKLVPENIEPDSFKRKQIIKEISTRLEDQLTGNESHNQLIRALWKKAAQNKFSQDALSKIVAAHTNRAKQLLPIIRKDVISEARGSRSSRSSSTNGEEVQRTVKVGSSKSESGGRSINDIDWSQMNDMDYMNGKRIYKK